LVPPHTPSLEFQLGSVPEIHPVKSGQEVPVSRKRNRVLRGPLGALHNRSFEPQLGLVPEIYPVKTGQEVPVSRKRKGPGPRNFGVLRGPIGAPNTRSFELPLGLVPEIHPVIHKELLDKTVNISEMTSPSGSSFGVVSGP